MSDPPGGPPGRHGAASPARRGGRRVLAATGVTKAYGPLLGAGRDRPVGGAGRGASPCWGRAGAGSRPCCGCWPAWSPRPGPGGGRRPAGAGTVARPAHGRAGRHPVPLALAAGQPRVGAAGAGQPPGRRPSSTSCWPPPGWAATADLLPRQLSGGMRQRAAIAQVLANQPPLLLLDEPFGALDAQTRLRMQEWLIGLLAERGTATVLVTHDVEEALLIGHRLVRLSHRPATVVEERRPRPAVAPGADDAGRPPLRRAQGRGAGPGPRCLSRPARRLGPLPGRVPRRQPRDHRGRPGRRPRRRRAVALRLAGGGRPARLGDRGRPGAAGAGPSPACWLPADR